MPSANAREAAQPNLVLLLPHEAADAELAARLVAVLYAAAGPVPRAELARALDVSRERLDQVCAHLARTPPLGLVLVEHQGELALGTAPTAAAAVERFLGTPPPVRLSRAALEALAVVAYEQPVTRAEVEAVRGVNSDSAIATLIGRGLVAEVGRRETVGRPALLATTAEFLRYLGLGSLEELPPLPDERPPDGNPPSATPRPTR
jgi:segregation and condensation protein B